MAARQFTYAPPRQPHWPPPARTNALAKGALVLGIVPFVSFFPLGIGAVIFLPLGIAAIIAGAEARRQIRETGEAGYGRATLGRILGWIGMATLIGLAVGSVGPFG